MSDLLKQLQTDEEVDEILRLAIRKTGVTDQTLQERLRESAQELGISEDALQMAAQEYYGKQTVEADRIAFEQYRKQTFYEHLIPYVAVNGFLIGIWFFTSRGDTFWPIFPMLGWGIGLAIHFAMTFFIKGSDYEKEFEKWRRKRDKRLQKLSG